MRAGTRPAPCLGRWEHDQFTAVLRPVPAAVGRSGLRKVPCVWLALAGAVRRPGQPEHRSMMWIAGGPEVRPSSPGRPQRALVLAALEGLAAVLLVHEATSAGVALDVVAVRRLRLAADAAAAEPVPVFLAMTCLHCVCDVSCRRWHASSR